MAREVIIRMSDDFDRSLPADEVIEFTIEGVTYVLDLTTDHANEWRSMIKPYMDAAHEVVKLTKEGKPRKSGPGGSQPGTRKARQHSPVDEPSSVREKLREWAAANGYKTMPRGLVKDEIRQAYSEATGNPVALNVRLRADEVEMGQMELIHQAEHDEPNTARHSADERFQDAVAKLPKPKAAKATKKAPDVPNANGVTQEMRDWARANGHNVRSSNGYVSRELRDQFEEEKAAGLLSAHAEQNGALV